MISKLSIKQKLIAIMLIPLVIVILLAAKLAYDSYRSLENLKSLDKVVILSTKIGALVHETQKERGMTAGFIGSKGVKFKDDLPKQIADFNKFSKTENLCIIGDYNISFCDNYYFTNLGRTELNKSFVENKINNLTEIVFKITTR